MSSTHVPKNKTMTRREIVKRMDREARARRGMTAKQLVVAYRAGTLREPCEVMDILGLAYLLPESDPLHAPLAG